MRQDELIEGDRDSSSEWEKVAASSWAYRPGLQGQELKLLKGLPGQGQLEQKERIPEVGKERQMCMDKGWRGG